MGRFLDPNLIPRLIELSKGSYRPKAILDLQKEIENEKRAAELNFGVTGVVDRERVGRIVEMKLRLDCLYGEWVEGKIG